MLSKDNKFVKKTVKKTVKKEIYIFIFDVFAISKDKFLIEFSINLYIVINCSLE